MREIPDIDTEQLFDKAEVAEVLGISNSRLANLIRRGEFTGARTVPGKGARHFWYGWQVIGLATRLRHEEAEKERRAAEQVEEREAQREAQKEARPKAQGPLEGEGDWGAGEDDDETRCAYSGCRRERAGEDGDPLHLGLCSRHGLRAVEILDRRRLKVASPNPA